MRARRRPQGIPGAEMPLLCFLLLLLLTPSYALLDPGDFLALQALHKSLSDMPGSTYFSTWDFTGDPCNFPGVLCAGDRVITLSLGDPKAGSPGLIGRLDPSVGRLTALTELSLVPGRVFGAIPTTIASLRDLRFMALSRNLLSGPVPPGLATLTRLQTLDLSFNLLTGPVAQQVAAMPELTNLILAHNRLSGSLPTFTAPLLRLDLKHNDLTGPVTAPFPSTLQYLSLSSNHLTGTLNSLTSSSSTSLPALSYLDLASNNFTGLVPPPLLALPSARTILLNRNLLYGPVLPPTQVTADTVDLSYNRLFGMVSPLFAPVKQLYLNNNRFSGVVPAQLVQRLADGDGGKTLYLQHNFLTGIEIGPTAEIPMSSELCLQYNCMVPPPQSAACPLKAGTQKTRPVDQCVQWKKREEDRLGTDDVKADVGVSDDDDDDDDDDTMG